MIPGEEGGVNLSNSGDDPPGTPYYDAPAAPGDDDPASPFAGAPEIPADADPATPEYANA